MSNQLVQKPIVIDTDLASYRNAAAVVAAGITQGVRVTKLVLVIANGGVSTAGTVTITAPSDSAELYPPLSVAASIAAKTIIFTDEPTDAKGSLTWRDFAVTGVTATGTRLFLWTDV